MTPYTQWLFGLGPVWNSWLIVFLAIMVTIAARPKIKWLLLASAILWLVVPSKAATITLTWNPHSNKLVDGRDLPATEAAITFKLYRAKATINSQGDVVPPQDSDYAEIANGITSQTYDDTNVPSDGVYYYKLKATRPANGADSGYSNETSQDVASPVVPDGLTGVIRIVLKDGKVIRVAVLTQ